MQPPDSNRAKGGRPPLGAHKKTVCVKVAFDDVAYAALRARAAAARLSPAAYLRHLSERRRAVPPPPPAVNFQVVFRLNAYARGLAELQRMCGVLIEKNIAPAEIGGNLFSERLKREFGSLRAELAELRLALLGAGGDTPENTR